MTKFLRPARTVKPARDLVSLDEVRRHCRIDANDDDAHLAGCIAAAMAWLDGHAGVLGRALVTQTWAVSLDELPSNGVIRLPLGDLGAVSSITYYDADNASQTLSSATYSAHQDALGPFVEQVDGASWPGTYDRADAVTVTWTCGYGATPADVPRPIRQAAMMLAAHWFEERTPVAAGVSTAEIPLTVHSLIAPYRRRAAA